jgi:hypothetical protein
MTSERAVIGGLTVGPITETGTTHEGGVFIIIRDDGFAGDAYTPLTLMQAFLLHSWLTDFLVGPDDA